MAISETGWIHQGSVSLAAENYQGGVLSMLAMSNGQ